MKHTFEPGEPCNYMVSLTPNEARKLADILQKVRKELEKKVEKYRDILKGGDCTTRQQTILFDCEDKLELVERFIRMVTNDKKD